jgi:hypothetical protein
LSHIDSSNQKTDSVQCLEGFFRYSFSRVSSYTKRVLNNSSFLYVLLRRIYTHPLHRRSICLQANLSVAVRSSCHTPDERENAENETENLTGNFVLPLAQFFSAVSDDN